MNFFHFTLNNVKLEIQTNKKYMISDKLQSQVNYNIPSSYNLTSKINNNQNLFNFFEMSNPQQILGQFFMNLLKIRRHNMFQVPLPNQEVLAKTKAEINSKMATYYKNPTLKYYLKSLPPKALLDESVVMFVGSRTRPQNMPLRNQLIQLAIERAQKQQAKAVSNLSSQQKSSMTHTKHSNIMSQPKGNRKKQPQPHKDQQPQNNDSQIIIPNSDKDLARYYTHAFTKYEAMQKNQPQRWQSCAQTIIELADKGHPLSSMMLAKDYYFRIDSQDLEREKKGQLVVEAAQYFYQAVTPTNLNGLYYISQMLTQYPQLHQSTPQEIQELYIYASAYGNPLAYAKLAKMHKDKGNIKLYMKYLKQAAEGGCVEAQFNLGEEYRLGVNVKKDDVKAFAWFKHAGAHGFVYGKFNEALMLYHGSDCGRIKKNAKAALLQFEEIQRSNTIDVSAQIDEIMKQDQIQKQLQLALKEEQQEQKASKGVKNEDLTKQKTLQATKLSNNKK